ncbi:MAG: GAP family protein [Mycobacterium sp.]
MWTSVLVLAIAVNFEPTRFALVPMVLARRRPLVQLFAYQAGAMTVNLIFGLLILFVFRRNPLGTSASGGGRAQIAVGVAALIIALVMAVRWRLSRHKELVGPNSLEDPEKPRGIDRVLGSARGILRKGGSPWFAGLLGMGVGLPSVDFLAVLVIIATSHKPPLEQSAALVTFIALGSFLVTVPLITYLFAPAQTLQRIEQFAAWTRSRSQVEYAAILALVGFMLIGMGWAHL